MKKNKKRDGMKDGRKKELEVKKRKGEGRGRGRGDKGQIQKEEQNCCYHIGKHNIAGTINWDKMIEHIR